MKFGSRWVITTLWLSWSLISFWYSSSVYSCYLFFTSSASVRSWLFLSFIMLILAWNIPLISSIFLKRSLVFPILLFSSISLHCSFKKAFLSPLAGENSAFSWVYRPIFPLPFTSLLSSAICKASSDKYFVFLHFFYFGMVLVSTSYTMLWTSVHSSSGTQSTRPNVLNLFVNSTV